MRAVVVGGGSIGARHFRNLKSLGMDGVALVEPDPRRREVLAAENAGPVFPTLEEALGQRPDLAVIATPTQLHAANALQAAQAGCHLFIEKPLSHSLKGLEALDHEVTVRGLITLVACNMRFHPGPAAVKSLLDGGRVGRVLAARIQTGSYLPGWRPHQDYRESYSASVEHGGALLDCIHEIDLALWYFGPARLAGSAWLPAASIGLRTDGLAELLLRHDSGVLSNVHLNFIQRDYHRTCQVIGTEGTVYWDYSGHRVDVYGPDGKQVESIPGPPDWQVNQMYLDEMAHFLAAVREGRPTVNPLAGGLRALRIALEARESSSGDGP
jgi:predicted dehydrogenase